MRGAPAPRMVGYDGRRLDALDPNYGYPAMVEYHRQQVEIAHQYNLTNAAEAHQDRVNALNAKIDRVKEDRARYGAPRVAEPKPKAPEQALIPEDPHSVARMIVNAPTKAEADRIAADLSGRRLNAVADAFGVRAGGSARDKREAIVEHAIGYALYSAPGHGPDRDAYLADHRARRLAELAPKVKPARARRELPPEDQYALQQLAAGDNGENWLPPPVKANIAALEREGLIESTGQEHKYRLTEAGRALLGDTPPSPRGGAKPVREAALGRWDAGGFDRDGMSRDEIGRAHV